MARKTLVRLTGLAGAILLTAAGPAAAPPTRDNLARDNRMFLQRATKSLRWEVPAAPMPIVGPIYFVGTQGLGSYLIHTSDGLILMGTGLPSSGPMIAASIRKLGFKPEDIKIIVTWHAHADHVGAVAYFKQLSGAKLAMMEGDVASMQDGGKSDFHYGWDWKTMGWPPAKVDRVLHDGDKVRLGEVELTALATPGHTRGDTSWTTTVVDNDKTYTVVWPDGLSVNPGYRVGDDRPSYRGIGDDYRRIGARLAALKPDIWLVAHVERFDLEGKRARAAQIGAEAFVDPAGYQKYIADQRAAFVAEAAREARTSPDDGIKRGPAPDAGSAR